MLEESRDQKFARRIVGGLIAQLMFEPTTVSLFTQEILERVVVDSVRVSVSPTEMLFEVRVRERRAPERIGVTRFAFPCPLPEPWDGPGAAEDQVTEFILELNEDLTGERPVNSLRWE